ncbi:MAG: hypothetical protein ACRC14_17095 [Paracoccaceae bacterium]
MTGCYITGMAPWDAPLPCADGIEEYVVTSSAEIGIVSTARAQHIIRTCAPVRRIGTARAIPLISIGCAGLYAAVLRFIESPAQSVRILALESPCEYVQATLDQARLGQGGDGFIAQDVAHVLDLSKSPDHAIARIAHCEIMSRPDCFAGTAKLARRFVDRMEGFHALWSELRVVTFENVSPYARYLMQAVQNEMGSGQRRRFLDTIERDERHFMTVRPMLDMECHMGGTCVSPLVISCLGAGGRIGVIAITSADDTSAALAPGPGGCLPQSVFLGDVACIEPTLPPAPRQPAALHYMDRSYFGRANFFFEWSIIGETLQCTS